MSDSFNVLKLWPNIPKPTSSSAKNTVNSAISHPYCSCNHGANHFALKHHQVSVTEQNERDFDTQLSLASSRWNPTPEQLQILEELYKHGMRTPTAQQIQQLVAHLRSFGKIEGKNVFYWFQNHKARERQKRRREFVSHEEQQCDTESLENKESGLRRTGYEVEQTKNWAPPSNCMTLSEEPVSMHRARQAMEERELQKRRSTVERQATCQMKGQSRSPLNHLMNTMTTTSSLDTKLSNTQNFSILLTPSRENFTNLGKDDSIETQILQLFPLHSCDGNCNNVIEKDSQVPITDINTNFTPNQFFEFLPPKN